MVLNKDYHNFFVCVRESTGQKLIGINVLYQIIRPGTLSLQIIPKNFLYNLSLKEEKENVS